MAVKAAGADEEAVRTLDGSAYSLPQFGDLF